MAIHSTERFKFFRNNMSFILINVHYKIIVLLLNIKANFLKFKKIILLQFQNFKNYSI